jgi:quinol monooxygenase YgiN
MNNYKLETLINLFEGSEIRSVWDKDKEDYSYSVVDVISALTDSKEPRKYWSVLKTRLKKEGSQVTTNCSQLKMLAPDGKTRMRDALDTEGIFRLIESVPSPKAEPFKVWLAKLGRKKVDEAFDPSKGIDEMITKGIVDRIRKEEGNLRYEYFFPLDEPETVLLIDKWKDEESLDIHHKSEMMKEIAELRKKYNLKMKIEKYKEWEN